MQVYILLSILSLVAACTYPSANRASNVGEPTNSANVAPASLGGDSQAARPEALVADLYKQHDAKNSPFFQTKSRAHVDKYFTKKLADLIWKDAVSSKGEVGTLDADPLYNAQDIEIRDLKVGPAEIKGDTATVKVTFLNYTDKNSLLFSLDLVNNAWKIADIGYGGKHTLLSWLKTDPLTTAGDELLEFEGKYLVGDTSCTVDFKNKGYAVKWAKGSGIEYFSFMDGTTFASSTVESEANKFVFDNENYNTGNFYRADGKTFPVRRAR